jgi:hypothetical protein
MDLETSKKLLKIFGIIIIVLGAIGILIGLLAFAGGGLIAAADQSELAAIGAGAAVIAGIILVISGIVSLLQGIFSVRAAKDPSKIMPAWVFAILGIVSSVISIITNWGKGTSSIVGAIVGTAISVVIFIAANNIKKANG